MADRAAPAALGFSMPAEWEPHATTWIGWPHNASDWPGKLAAIQWVYGEIVRKLAPGETVRILVQSGEHERQARRVLERTGVDRARVEFLRVPTNRGWTRDFGPMFVRRARPPAEVAIVRFRFNAWAKYPDWKKDDQVPERVARRRKVRLLPAQCGGHDVVLEGGSIDVNGRGTLLEDGSKIEVVDLPMPAPLQFHGQRLPASYANFYVGNAAVLVPTFNDPNDRSALGLLAELFTDRAVVGIHAVDLVWGLGTIHCLTQQEPEGKTQDVSRKSYAVSR